MAPEGETSHAPRGADEQSDARMEFNHMEVAWKS